MIASTPRETGVDESLSRLALSKSRLVLVSAIFMVGYLAVCLRLVDLTLFQDRHTSEVSGVQDIKPMNHPLRGEILDRNGEIMASSLKMASIYADATIVENPSVLAGALAKILPGQSQNELLEKLSSGKKFIWIQRNVTPKQEYAINALGSPALNFQEEDRRIYPSANLAAHITGYTDVDGSGISGIEKSYDAPLRKGDDPIRLTIDLRVQHILHRELAAMVKKFSAKAGVGIIMDVNTGEILAMVSLPDFDPHHPGESPDDARFNRASLGVFEMGSTFKLFSTAAALDTGHVHFSSTFDASEPIKYGRFTISDYHAKKRVLTVPEIFIYSSNIGTAKMAMSIGTPALQSFYRKVGFFDPVPLELPERGAPLYPKPWGDLSTLTTSFGHGIAVSPVHLVRAAAALVNGGVLVKPTLVMDPENPLSQTPAGPRVISPQTSTMIRKLLELVVASGTGGKAYVDGYDVGGKTGTAEKNHNGHYIHNLVLSSFMGVFPMRAPRYAVLAMVDEPQPIAETHGFVTAGWTAAPVVGSVIAQMAPLYGMLPEIGKDHDIVKDMTIYLKEAGEGKSIATLGTDH
jgi:cell division protein FtsI (penicillin-binding protein 3)